MNKPYWPSLMALLLTFGLSVRPVQKSANAAVSTPVVTLGKPVRLTEAKDSLQLITTGSSAFEGRLVYTQRMIEAPYQSYLILVEANKKEPKVAIRRKTRECSPAFALFDGTLLPANKI